MFRRAGLRTRIAIGLVGFSLATSIAFGVSAYWATDVMEVLVLEQNIGEQARRIAKTIASGEAPQLPESDWYYARMQSGGDVASEFTQLQSGSHHEVMVDDREFHLWIEPVSNDRLFLFYDLAVIEAYESRLSVFLISTGVILGVFAFLLGLFLTPWVARPLTALAQRVAKLPRDARRLDGPEHEDADLAVLADAIDAYLSENSDLVQRERSFTGMASHELRTPIATISAALDVIALEPQQNNIAAPMRRIRRATDRMENLIEVLLDLARDQDVGESTLADWRPADMIREILADETNQTERKQHKVELDLDDSLVLEVQPAMFRMIAGNLIANALTHGTGDTVRIQLSSTVFSVENDGEIGPQPSRGRLGLSIVDVICARLGWRFQYTSGDGVTAADVLITHSP